MSHHLIRKSELIQALLALFVAISLQVVTREIGTNVLPGSQYFIILTELVLAFVMLFTINTKASGSRGIHRAFAVVLIALISAANVSGLAFVLRSLITGHGTLSAEQLLASAIAIFITNVIVFALWYWEIDSPGLTRTRWSRNDKDFQFTQQDLPGQFANWQPQFGDYMYLSITNAVNFAPSDSKPLTLQAKMLMATQSLVSVFTLALVIARSVSILGS